MYKEQLNNCKKELESIINQGQSLVDKLTQLLQSLYTQHLISKADNNIIAVDLATASVLDLDGFKNEIKGVIEKMEEGLTRKDKL